jgi:S1-C subfamily serine protease
MTPFHTYLPRAARFTAATALVMLVAAACGTGLGDEPVAVHVAPGEGDSEVVASTETLEVLAQPSATSVVVEVIAQPAAPDADVEAATAGDEAIEVAVTDQSGPGEPDSDMGEESPASDPFVDEIDPEGLTEATLLADDHPVLSTVDVVKLLKPSVVHIATEFLNSGFMDQPEPGSGVGTGIILDRSGHILTNNHVVANAQSLIVTLNTGENREAVIVGTDPTTDLAVIRIDAPDLFPAFLGVSGELQVGEDVIAIGHALGLPGGPTVSKGVVSALGRSISADAQNTIVDLIQTDASINPGNSGGTLVNEHGEVIGINTAIIQEGRGIGFAINIDDAKVVAEQLIAAGFVDRGFLGVTPFNLTSALANQYGIPVEEGVIIQRAVPGSGAAEAGLQQGDVIVMMDDVEIHNTGELSRFLINHTAGETITIVYYRGTERIEATVTLTVRPG